MTSVPREADLFFFFQAEDGIRDLVRSRGLGDVYKRQAEDPDGQAHDPQRGRGLVDRDGVAGVQRAEEPGLSLIHI